MVILAVVIWCKIDGVKDGLHQHYEIESTTDYFSLNTGRVMAKIGVNDRKEYHNKVEVKFVIIDNKPHLNENGIDYMPLGRKFNFGYNKLQLQ